jgi:hypothetical protein
LVSSISAVYSQWGRNDMMRRRELIRKQAMARM